MVMGDNSCLKGCLFESQRRILDGHFFTLIRCKNCIVCLKRPKTNEKEAEVGPFLKNFTTTTVTVLACNVLASRISVLAFDPTAYMTESSSTVRQTFSLV